MVSVEQMMKARDTRLHIQKELLRKYQSPIIYLTLNIPGQIKTSKNIRACFQEGIRLLKNQILSEHFYIHQQILLLEPTGYEYIISLDATASQLKEITIALENTKLIGRIFDYDVIDSNHHKLSREDLGYPSRKCLLCNQPAFLCARSRKHSVQELLLAIDVHIDAYFQQQFSDRIVESAVNAMLTELSVSPKPGLVDRFDNGAHSDMNFFTFVDSSTSMYPYFEQFVHLGFHVPHITKETITQLKTIGRNCEQNMFSTTNQINTHKGALFSLGCFLFCIGYSYPNLTFEVLQSNMRQLSKSFSLSYDQNTNGAKLYKNKQSKGIRGEIEACYATVFTMAYPSLCKFLKLTPGINDACILTLLHIIATIDDSNIISRSDNETADYVKNIIKQDLNSLSYSETLSKVPYYNTLFVEFNISPGGSADLLCLSIFLYNIFHKNTLA